ncbi:MAG: site-specific integrase [Nitrospirota bacterium]
MGLYRRPDSEIYWMSFAYNGRIYRKSTGTSDMKLAKKILAKVQTQIVEGKWFDIDHSKEKTLREMTERYEREYMVHRKYYSLRREKSIVKHLYAYFGESCTLGEIEHEIGGYEQFRKSKGRSPATIVKELGLLRTMFNIARKQWRWKIDNPVSDIKLPKVRNERVRYLSDGERLNLVDALESSEDTWLYSFVIIAIDTGLRLANLCDMKWSEVNLFSRMITVHAEGMKNDDYLGVPLTDRAFQVLKELQKIPCLSGHVFHDNGKKLYDRKVQRAFRKVLEKAKINNFHFHDLRHTFASYLRQNGVDLHTISKLLGHKDLRMTKRYAHLNVDSLRSAISKINFTFSSRFDEKKQADNL